MGRSDVIEPETKSRGVFTFGKLMPMQTVNKGGRKKGMPRVPGGGRKKGTPNHINKDLRDCIVRAAELAGREIAKHGSIDLERHGGTVVYLRKQALENPQAFLPLLGKTLPAKFEGPPGTPALVINIVKNFDDDQSNEPEDDRGQAAAVDRGRKTGGDRQMTMTPD
jgi:hypothetical protein